jgi:hypothetical protein
MSRIYKIVGADGKPRHVEANTRAAAIQHVYAPVVSGPLTGAQVAALLREDPAAVEIVGETV